MACPWPLAAFQDTATFPSAAAAVARTEPGASGTSELGVKGADWAGGPAPTLLRAVTVAVYEVPLCSPGTSVVSWLPAMSVVPVEPSAPRQATAYTLIGSP